MCALCPLNVRGYVEEHVEPYNVTNVLKKVFKYSNGNSFSLVHH